MNRRTLAGTLNLASIGVLILGGFGTLNFTYALLTAWGLFGVAWWVDRTNRPRLPKFLRKAPPLSSSAREVAPWKVGRHTCSCLNDQGQREVWNVPDLWEASKGLPVEDLPLSEVVELDDPTVWLHFWKTPGNPVVACEMPRVLAADLSYPILLRPDGGMLDGYHRVAKALIAGDTHIKAVRFTEENMPKPLILGFDP